MDRFTSFAVLSRLLLTCATLAVVGCESSPVVEEREPVDPEVAAVEQEVADYLALLESRDALPDTAPPAPPPDIHWSDPAWQAANQRETPPVSPPPRSRVTPTVPPQEPEPPVVVEATPEPAPNPEPPVAVAPEPLSRDELLAMLLSEVRQSDDPAMAKALASVGVSLIDPQRSLDESLLTPLTRSQRQRVTRFHDLIVAIGQGLNSGDDADIDAITARFEELFDRPVEIRTFALCRRVDGYGMYDPFDSNAFPAGRPLRLGLYVEIDHFDVEREGEFHVVRLSQEVTLFKDDLIVWREPVAQVVDRSRNRRRDFFTTQVIRLPETLGSGKYTLKIRITDQIGNTLDERAQTLQLVADPAMAERGRAVIRDR